MTAVREGSIAWCRCWFSDRIKRGALVQVNGAPAHILSARGGYLYVADWGTGRRVQVRPSDVSFPNT
jgi:hypothetical protein